MQQEVVLALLAKEPSQGYQLRARLEEALGALGEGLNAGHIYVTLGRLEKTGMVALEEPPRGRAQRADRKVYHLTPAGQERVFQWLSEVSWPRPDLAEFHLKLVAAAQAGCCHGGAGPLQCSLAAGGSRVATPGGPALAGDLRAELGRPKGAVMTPTRPVLRAS